MSFAGCEDDNALGPIVLGCRDHFDFTLKFEKLCFSIVPGGIFLLATTFRIFSLLRKPSIIKGQSFRAVKLLSMAIYVVLQFVQVGLASLESTTMRVLLVSAATLHAVSSFAMLPLSALEHSRSPRPSVLLSTYLSVTLLFDVAQTRTLWLDATAGNNLTITRLTTAAVALKAMILVLESQRKTRWAVFDPKQRSPEELAGLFGLGVYMWLNKLFLTGYRQTLSIDDLYPLDSRMKSGHLEEKLSSVMMTTTWQRQRYGLAKLLVKTLTPALLLPIGPRLALIGFKFCQPFLIQSTLSFLEQPPDKRDTNTGYGLIGATCLIFGGIALSTSCYWYLHERLMWMTRGALASAIYRKTTEARISIIQDASALTIMSTDVERLRQGMLMMHELWANCIESAIASYLLYRTLATAFAAPIILVVVCVACAFSLARFTGHRQYEWMGKIQTRVGITARVIASMESLRISGLAVPVQTLVHTLRLDELKAGGRFRLVICWSLLIAYMPFFIAPVITFAWTSTSLEVTTMFTSYTYLSLLCIPLTSLIQGFPQIVAAVACLRRIQTFLEQEKQMDYRQGPSEPSSVWASERGGPLVDTLSDLRPSDTDAAILIISGGAFGWGRDTVTLRDINTKVPTRQLTMVVGPVGSGKTTLCKAMLGEAIIISGAVVLHRSLRDIGYCSQEPFLLNASVRQNIIGLSAFDEGRYAEVIHSTMLEIDLLDLPQGDQTIVGSNGSTLSGGQKQRLSLARALYAETDFLIFDDILSSLDKDTETQIFCKVFGTDGLIKRRGATAVLCTHAIRHLPSADHVVALKDGTITEQGSFDELSSKPGYVSGLELPPQGFEKVLKKPAGCSTGLKPAPHSIGEQLRTTPITESQKLESGGKQMPTRVGDDRSVYKHYYLSIGFWPVAALLVISAVVGFFCNFQTIWLDFWSAGIAAQPPTHDNTYYLLWFGGMQILGLVALLTSALIGLRWVISLSGAALHRDALDTLFNAPLRLFSTMDNGTITNLFSQDMTLIDSELPLAMVNVVLEVAICIGMAAVIATSSPYLAITYPFLVLILFALQRFYLRTSKQLRLLDLEAKSPLYTQFMDTIKGLDTFRSFGWAPHSVIQNDNLLDTSQRPAYLLAMIQRWLAFTLDVIAMFLAIMVVALSSQLVSSTGTGLTGASLVTLITFGSSLTSFIRCYTLMETSLGAISRLKTFSTTANCENRGGEDLDLDDDWPQKGNIEISNVSASYSDVLSEPQADNNSETPSTGTSSDRGLVIRHLSLNIHARQKVAICGRTGSGKSSLLLLILRLLDPVAIMTPQFSDKRNEVSIVPTPNSEKTNTIFIDGVPLHRVDRTILRERVIAIPQEAVFLPEGRSFRENLDPYGFVTVEECQTALNIVSADLWLLVENKGGLEGDMNPDALSQGQKQLFSLARAILRKRYRSRDQDKTRKIGTSEGGILLLDEMSSSVDVDTERVMHAAIRTEFEGYTVIMVSHRLEMIMDYDMVVMMAHGAVVESGAPRKLLEAERSRFRDLVGDTLER